MARIALALSPAFTFACLLAADVGMVAVGLGTAAITVLVVSVLAFEIHLDAQE